MSECITNGGFKIDHHVEFKEEGKSFEQTTKDGADVSTIGGVGGQCAESAGKGKGKSEKYPVP